MARQRVTLITTSKVGVILLLTLCVINIIIGYIYNATELQTIQFECKSTPINLDKNIDKHLDKLSLIVGDPTFTKILSVYCNAMGMEVIERKLDIASSFWIMDNEKYEKNPNKRENLIHAPFFTNQEYDYRYNVHNYDFVYLFVNKYGVNIKNTFKLIDYSMLINVTCFVLITNSISKDLNSGIHTITGYLQYAQLNYIIFKLDNLIIPNNTILINNNKITLLLHKIMDLLKSDHFEISDIDGLSSIYNHNLSLLNLQDVAKYIAISSIYQHLYKQTFYITSKLHHYSFSTIVAKILNTLNYNKQQLVNKQNKMDYIQSHDYEWNKFEYCFDNQFVETPIETIINQTVKHFDTHKDLISLKRNAEPFDKSAVYCDTRFEPEFVEIILNFMINLDSSWQFELFVGKDTMHIWKDIEILKPYIITEKIVLKNLSKYYENDILEFYQNKQFWKSIKYEKILMFQSDSVLCSYSKYRVEDFLEYDYIGAPWKKYGRPDMFGRVGNGGLSLRSKSVMLKLLEQYPPKKQDKFFRKFPDDIFITHFIGLLNGVHLPNYLIAKYFAVESDHYKMEGHDIGAGFHRHFINDLRIWGYYTYLCYEYNLTFNRILIKEAKTNKWVPLMKCKSLSGMSCVMKDNSTK